MLALFWKAFSGFNIPESLFFSKDNEISVTQRELVNLHDFICFNLNIRELSFLVQGIAMQTFWRSVKLFCIVLLGYQIILPIHYGVSKDLKNFLTQNLFIWYVEFVVFFYIQL